jgi:hypothetical protein
MSIDENFEASNSCIPSWIKFLERHFRTEWLESKASPQPTFYSNLPFAISYEYKMRILLGDCPRARIRYAMSVLARGWHSSSTRSYCGGVNFPDGTGPL